MTIITCIEDLRVLAQRRVPKMFYDYVDVGSWTESTYRANESDFQRVLLRQRVAVDLSNRSVKGTMLGREVSMPVAIAPTGLTGMIHADGEILAARAAKQFGIPFTLSTVSICSIEDIAEATDGHPFWFQLYMMRDRQFVERLIQRAYAAQCDALVLTLDLPISGQRHKDLKNGLTAPPRLSARNLVNMMGKPRWCLRMLGTKRHSFGNIVGHADGVGDMASMADWSSKQYDPSMTWEDIAWVRRLWDRKLILKGILDPDDARQAQRIGADAIVVSNHGGRQLDGAPSSLRALPKIAEAVGTQLEVHLDGGIRSGQDVIKALALGARGVYIGRAMLYGLGAMGEPGVTRALDIIHRELDLTMAFCGRTRLTEINADILLHDAYTPPLPG
jgi:L-lactate dehydrogenase (cytochrome)